MGQKIGIIVLLSIAATGCATTAQKTETETLKTQVTSLQSQVEDLSQRVEDLSPKNGTEPSSRHSVNRTQTTIAPSLSPRMVQTALKQAGYYDGPIDGKYGKQTVRAIKTFQKAKGLTADGKVGTKTVAALTKYLSDSKEE